MLGSARPKGSGSRLDGPDDASPDGDGAPDVLRTRLSRAELKSLVLQAVREAVQDEFLPSRCGDAQGRRIYRDDGAVGAPSGVASNPVPQKALGPSPQQRSVDGCESEGLCCDTPKLEWSGRSSQVESVASNPQPQRALGPPPQQPTLDGFESEGPCCDASKFELSGRSSQVESDRRSSGLSVHIDLVPSAEGSSPDRHGHLARLYQGLRTSSSFFRHQTAHNGPSNLHRVEADIIELNQRQQMIIEKSYSWRSLLGPSGAENFLAFIILANAVTIGLQSDMVLRGNTHWARKMQYVNWAMVAFFVVELCARVSCTGRAYLSWHGPNFGWNLFDFVTVVSSASDALLYFMSSPVRVEQVSYLRIIRILRVTQAFRVVRILPFFRELRVMVGGVLKCSKSLLWAIALMVLVSYLFAILVVQGCSCSSGGFWSDDGGDCKFSSLGHIMYILFQATTGGMDWGELADDLWEFAPFLVAGLCLYVMAVTFVVVNVITAVFVEAALGEQSQDPEGMLFDSIQKKREWLLGMREFFNRCEQECGTLTGKDLASILDRTDTRTSLRGLGIDAEHTDMSMLRGILDNNGDGQVTLDEFVYCLQGLRGQARSSDIMILRSEIRKLTRQLDGVSVPVVGN